MLTCGCGCFCNNEQESPPSIRQRRLAGRRDHYIRMSDCESPELALRPPASWRCRGNGQQDVANIYRDRRLCANFDIMMEPAPPSYTVSMQHNYNYFWNQPTAAAARGASHTVSDSVRMTESNHSHVHNTSMIHRLTRVEDAGEETSMDDVQEEKKCEEEGGEEDKISSALPPSYDNTRKDN